MTRKTYSIDMTYGPVFGKIVRFSIPLMASGILQLLYNAADLVVVGRFTGSTALAAVGSTGSLINLLVNLFVGLSLGVNIVAAADIGKNDTQGIHHTVHTAAALGAVCGVVMGFVGWFAANPLLRLMSTPTDVIAQATLYVKIYFVGVPMLILYNFGSALLRSIGDTKRPLYILMITGIVNVVFNLLFVIKYNMGVAGVAIATDMAQFLSAIMIWYCVAKSEIFQFRFAHVRIYKYKLLSISRHGLPAGVQSVLFNISNVLIQASINTFGSVAVAGNSAASNILNFVYTAMNTFHHAAVNFVAQNMGAKKFNRIPRIIAACCALATISGLLSGGLAWLFGKPLLGIYTSEADVITYGMERLAVFAFTYFTCGVMDALSGELRGMGYSMLSMIVSLIGACGLRIVWIYTLFVQFHSLFNLYLSYPVSWIITALALVGCIVYAYHRVQRPEKQMVQ